MSDVFFRGASLDVSWLVGACREQIIKQSPFGVVVFLLMCAFHIAFSILFLLVLFAMFGLRGMGQMPPAQPSFLILAAVLPLLFLVNLETYGVGAVLSSKVALSLGQRGESWKACWSVVWAQRWELSKLCGVISFFQAAIVVIMVMLFMLMPPTPGLTIVGMVMMLLFMIGSLIAAAQLFIVWPAICVGGLSFSEAMSRSSHWLEGHRLKLIAMWVGVPMAISFFLGAFMFAAALLPDLLQLLVGVVVWVVELIMIFFMFMYSGVLIGAAYHAAAAEQGQLDAAIDAEIFS